MASAGTLAPTAGRRWGRRGSTAKGGFPCPSGSFSKCLNNRNIADASASRFIERGLTCDASFRLWRFARWDLQRTANARAPRSPIRGVPSRRPRWQRAQLGLLDLPTMHGHDLGQQRLLRNQDDVPRPPTRDDPGASRAAPAIRLLAGRPYGSPAVTVSGRQRRRCSEVIQRTNRTTRNDESDSHRKRSAKGTAGRGT
jgi:hypothetical protein